VQLLPKLKMNFIDFMFCGGVPKTEEIFFTNCVRAFLLKCSPASIVIDHYANAHHVFLNDIVALLFHELSTLIQLSILRSRVEFVHKMK
jgi:hypothetical protein